MSVVNIGAIANDGTGDTLRGGGIKINNAFQDLEGDVIATLPYYPARMLDVREYGAVGDSVINDRAAFVDADAAGIIIVLRGTYLISTSLTITNSVHIFPGAIISVASGQTVTFAGGVEAGAYSVFAGSGTVSLTGQRTKVYAEWWGAVADNSTDCATAMNKAIAALPNGGVIQGLNGQYRLGSNVDFTNAVKLVGMNRGLNPEAGGTIYRPTNAFSTGGSTNRLFTVSAGSVDFEGFFILGDSTTSTAQNYTAIYVTAGAGKLHWFGVEIFGCGIGVDFEQGNVGDFYGLSVYGFSTAGLRFGGVANVYSGPWRFFGGVVNNPNSLNYTNASELSGATSLQFASTTGMEVGMGVAGVNIPSGVTITAKTSTSITLSAGTSGAIANGATIRFGYYVIGACLRFLGNAFDIYMHNMEIAGGATMIDVPGSPAAAGIFKPNVIWLNGMNATASAGTALVIRRCINFWYTDGWIGDVPFSSCVSVAGQGNDATQIDTVVFEQSVIGGAGENGIVGDYFTNMRITDCEIGGNSTKGAGVYNHVNIGANAVGSFRMVNTDASNKAKHSITGANAAYGLLLGAGAFGGSGDSVVVVGNALGGATGAFADSSSPTGTLKVFANNVQY